VPNGSTVDMTERIEQVERFAPGFRDRISRAERGRRSSSTTTRTTSAATSTASRLATAVHGPVAKIDPYATPTRGLYLCSSSTPPAAACTACAASGPRDRLSREFGIRA
jgi:phytoene dehydrogenase-like protein